MRLSLKMKLVLSSLSLIFFTILVFGGIAYQTLKEQAWQGINSEGQRTATAYSQGIGDWFNGRQHAVEATVDAIEREPSLDIVGHLKQTLTSGGFGLTYYGTREGVMYRHDPALNKAGYDPRSRGWYKEAAAARKQITTMPYVSHTMQTLVVTLAEPVYRNGQLVGVVGANLALDKLVKDILDIEVSGDGYAMLLDLNSDRVVAHPDNALQMKSLAELGRGMNVQALKQAAVAGDLLFTQLDGRDKVVVVNLIPNTGWAITLVMDKATLEAPLNAMLLEVILVGIAILASVSVISAWWVARLLQGLNRVSAALSDIADGDGDLTVRIAVHSDDEVGRLAEKFNHFVSRLHTMAVNLRDITLQLNRSAAETAGAASERSERIRRQQDEITMVATAVTEMASATHEIAGNADNTAKTAENAVAMTEEGHGQVSQSQSSIGNLAQEVNSAVGIIEDLNEHAQKISSILATIRAIAEQTNLLALNAAIEAARAGEQGRGFAVVADEVRVLSQRTHTSTEEIQGMIETLQSTTKQAVTVMSDSHHLAETSVQDVDAAGASINSIAREINVISDMATQIASAAEEQSSVTSEISRNTEGVQEVANQLAQEAREAASQADGLKCLADKLELEVKRYKL